MISLFIDTQDDMHTYLGWIAYQMSSYTIILHS